MTRAVLSPAAERDILAIIEWIAAAPRRARRPSLSRAVGPGQRDRLAQAAAQRKSVLARHHSEERAQLELIERIAPPVRQYARHDPAQGQAGSAPKQALRIFQNLKIESLLINVQV